MNKLEKRDSITIADKEYTIIRVLGEKKGGYLYVATDGRKLSTIWIMKEAEDRGKRIDEDLKAAERFACIGIRVPQIMAYDREKGILVREYIEGLNASSSIIRGELKKEQLEDIFMLAKRAEDAGICLNYFPTNYLIGRLGLYYMNYDYYDICDRQACEGRTFEEVVRKYWIL